MDGLADFGLVAVDLRRIDVMESELQGFRQNAQHIGAGHAESAEAERRNVGAVGIDGMHRG